MRRSRYLEELRGRLPGGVELHVFDPDGVCHVYTRAEVKTLDPCRDDGREEFLRFIDDGQFARYFIGDAKTSDAQPANATFKLGMVRPHSAFTPHAHGTEHFVLSLGYASCGLFDLEAERTVDLRLCPGMLLRIPAMMPHSFNNRADEPLAILPANTGMGIHHADYAISAADALSRPAPEYLRLGRALRHLEEEMPRSKVHNGLSLAERVAGRLRKLAYFFESR